MFPPLHKKLFYLGKHTKNIYLALSTCQMVLFMHLSSLLDLIP